MEKPQGVRFFTSETETKRDDDEKQKPERHQKDMMNVRERKKERKKERMKERIFLPPSRLVFSSLSRVLQYHISWFPLFK